MTLHTALALGLFWLAGSIEATRYPTQVVNFRDQTARFGFVNKTDRTNLRDVDKLVSFKWDTTARERQRDIHMNFGQLERIVNGDAETCKLLRQCDFKLFYSSNATHCLLNPFNPGTYTLCRRPNEPERVYVMPLLIVDAQRFFNISLDFLQLPDNFPDHYYVDSEPGEIAMRVHNGVPYITGIFDKHHEERIYRIDFGTATGQIRTIKFRLMIQLNTSNASRIVRTSFKYKAPGNGLLGLDKKAQMFRCVTHLLNLSQSAVTEIWFNETSSTTRTFIKKFLSKFSCEEIKSNWETLPEYCFYLKINEITNYKEQVKSALNLGSCKLPTNLNTSSAKMPVVFMNNHGKISETHRGNDHSRETTLTSTSDNIVKTSAKADPEIAAKDNTVKFSSTNTPGERDYDLSKDFNKKESSTFRTSNSPDSTVSVLPKDPHTISSTSYRGNDHSRETTLTSTSENIVKTSAKADPKIAAKANTVKSSSTNTPSERDYDLSKNFNKKESSTFRTSSSPDSTVSVLPKDPHTISSTSYRGNDHSRETTLTSTSDNIVKTSAKADPEIAAKTNTVKSSSTNTPGERDYDLSKDFNKKGSSTFRTSNSPDSTVLMLPKDTLSISSEGEVRPYPDVNILPQPGYKNHQVASPQHITYLIAGAALMALAIFISVLLLLVSFSGCRMLTGR